MQINLYKLPHKGQTVTIAGDESWLGDIYNNFNILHSGSPDLAEDCLKGELRLQQSTAQEFTVTGRISFAPLLNCSRCDELVRCDLSSSIDVKIRPYLNSEPSRGGEFDLSSDDLEYYFIEEDGVLDLFVIVNDIIHLNIPSQVLPGSPQLRQPHSCGQNVTEKIATQNTASEATSPFSVLSQLKDRLQK